MKTVSMITAALLIGGAAQAQVSSNAGGSVGGTAGGTTGAIGARPPITYSPAIGAMTPGTSASTSTRLDAPVPDTMKPPATAGGRARGAVGPTTAATGGASANGRVGTLAPGATATNPSVTGTLPSMVTPPR